jgi:hypothetical protein
VNQRPQVTADGDIYIHTKGSLTTDVTFTDELTGQPRVMTSRSVWFVASDGTRIQLTNGATTSTKVLKIPQNSFTTLVGKAASFVVVDETDTLHTVEWAGRLMVGGL